MIGNSVKRWGCLKVIHMSLNSRNVCAAVSTRLRISLCLFLSRSWLDNNGESAVKKLENSLPLRKELDRLKDELSHQLQLSDIR